MRMRRDRVFSSGSMSAAVMRAQNSSPRGASRGLSWGSTHWVSFW